MAYPVGAASRTASILTVVMFPPSSLLGVTDSLQVEYLRHPPPFILRAYAACACIILPWYTRYKTAATGGCLSEQGREVLDFIGYLRSASVRAASHQQQLTARELLQSGLVGLWADRDDIDDSLSFARRLREQAERRQGSDDDPA